MYKAATLLSVLMKVYSIPCHDRGHISVMLVLQSFTDSLQVMAGSSTEAFPTSCDGTYDVSNIKSEEDLDIKEEEEEVIMKTENVRGNEEEECIDIKDEEGAHGEEDDDEEEKIDIQEEEDVDIEEEVS